jgi:hypothetical protein
MHIEVAMLNSVPTFLGLVAGAVDLQSCRRVHHHRPARDSCAQHRSRSGAQHAVRIQKMSRVKVKALAKV